MTRFFASSISLLLLNLVGIYTIVVLKWFCFAHFHDMLHSCDPIKDNKVMVSNKGKRFDIEY